MLGEIGINKNIFKALTETFKNEVQSRITIP